MENIRVFEEAAQKYDRWFDKNRHAYKSELLVLRRFIPEAGRGLEVGVGTGRFATPLGIHIGVEPGKAMAEIAQRHGIKIYRAKAEDLPFNNESFDFILMVTTICFLENPIQALKEARRVLKPSGHIIIGMIDRDSFLGRLYESRKKESLFYRNANFYSVNQVINWLRQLKYTYIKICQTIFKNPEEITSIEPIKDGFGKGGFVVISAKKELTHRQIE
jgi:ubiquinone/menaquinone biosynthesis C-methylase UbiE